MLTHDQLAELAEGLERSLPEPSAFVVVLFKPGENATPQVFGNLSLEDQGQLLAFALKGLLAGPTNVSTRPRSRGN